jgi:hypothetical protein
MEGGNVETRFIFGPRFDAQQKTGSTPGKIEEGHYHLVDGAVIVTTMSGARVGSQPDTGDPVRTARRILREHFQKNKGDFWRELPPSGVSIY